MKKRLLAFTVIVAMVALMLPALIVPVSASQLAGAEWWQVYSSTRAPFTILNNEFNTPITTPGADGLLRYAFALKACSGEGVLWYDPHIDVKDNKPSDQTFRRSGELEDPTDETLANLQIPDGASIVISMVVSQAHEQVEGGRQGVYNGGGNNITPNIYAVPMALKVIAGDGFYTFSGEDTRGRAIPGVKCEVNKEYIIEYMMDPKADNGATAKYGVNVYDDAGRLLGTSGMVGFTENTSTPAGIKWFERAALGTAEDFIGIGAMVERNVTVDPPVPAPVGAFVMAYPFDSKAFVPNNDPVTPDTGNIGPTTDDGAATQPTPRPGTTAPPMGDTAAIALILMAVLAAGAVLVSRRLIKNR